MPPRAAQVPTLHFHGHARMAQVDCVANQEFCLKNHIRARHNNNKSTALPTVRDRHLPHLAGAYPTLRMYKDGDPINFELFTGQRTVDDVLKFIQQQMLLYKSKYVSRKQAHRRKQALPNILAEGSAGAHRRGARACAESHSVARKQEASKFSSRRGALVEGNDLYRAKMSVTEAREISRDGARDGARTTY